MLPDFKYAIRSLLKAPGFTAIAVLTLALCIGANSAIFSVIQAILLKPYPWPDSDRLVYVYNSYPLMGLPNAGTSIPDYLDFQRRSAHFSRLAAFTAVELNLTMEGSDPARLAALAVSHCNAANESSTAAGNLCSGPMR